MRSVKLAAALAAIVILLSSLAAVAEEARFDRSFGVLLHPTSLPGRYGIGDLGPQAFRFVDHLKACGARLWQTLPMGPTGYGDSPYACFSAFAGNPLLISPDALVETGLLSKEDVAYVPRHTEAKVDYGLVINHKRSLFDRAYERFKKIRGGAYSRGYDRFVSANGALWLDDFALFMALKEKHGGAVWSDWEPKLALRDEKALAKARRELRDKIGFFKFLQYEFHREWNALREYANSRGIKLVGDIPIFVAYDSADVWTHPWLFALDGKGKPVSVAGVPPDFFSATGQYWGNPLYDWRAHEKSAFAWWKARFRHTLRLFDVVRIDHFRGFEAYWEIPASESTAVNGRWVKAPGAKLFAAIERSLGRLPVIAEDLGVITPEVEKIRDDAGFYGMKILQFGFSGNDGDAAKYLPHTFTTSRSAVYTGTHDNETTAGWYKNLDERSKKAFRDYTRSNGSDPARAMIRLAMASMCDIAIVPFQDIIAADNTARMNTPGTFGDKNWSYRMREGDMRAIDALRMRHFCRIYER